LECVVSDDWVDKEISQKKRGRKREEKIASGTPGRLKEANQEKAAHGGVGENQREKGRR